MIRPNPTDQGDIWICRLDPTEGSEIKKTRPCLIISRTKVNAKIRTISIIPISSGESHFRLLHIDLPATSENGLSQHSHLEINQIRTISKKRCLKRLGKASLGDLLRIRESFDSYLWNDLV